MDPANKRPVVVEAYRSLVRIAAGTLQALHTALKAP